MGAGEEGRSPTAASAEAHSGARGDEGGIREGSAGTKAGAGKAGAGKAAAVPPTKWSSPQFKEEVTSFGSSDIGPPPGFSGNLTPASMMNKGKEKAGVGTSGTGKAATLVTPKKEVTSVDAH